MAAQPSAQDRRREQLIEMRDVTRLHLKSPMTPASAVAGLVKSLKETNAELEALGGDIKDPLDELAAARAAREAG